MGFGGAGTWWEKGGICSLEVLVFGCDGGKGGGRGKDLDVFTTAVFGDGFRLEPGWLGNDIVNLHTRKADKAGSDGLNHQACHEGGGTELRPGLRLASQQAPPRRLS